MVGRARAIGVEVDVELDAFDGHLRAAGHVEVIAADGEGAEVAFDLAGIRAEVDEGGDEHVAGGAGGEVEMESFHGWRGWARSLMALAA